MSHRVDRFRWIVPAAILTCWALGSRSVRAAEDPRTVSRFLQALKTHGLHDIGLEYLNQLLNDPALPADRKAGLDYEEGRLLIDEAARSGDLVLREELLKEARGKLEGFVKDYPQRPEKRDALVQLAKLLVERG